MLPHECEHFSELGAKRSLGSLLAVWYLDRDGYCALAIPGFLLLLVNKGDCWFPDGWIGSCFLDFALEAGHIPQGFGDEIHLDDREINLVFRLIPFLLLECSGVDCIGVGVGDVFPDDAVGL